MSEKPAVSVIIPVYNAEKYLNDCIGSVINQTLKNIEIICVDDGSTDSSLEILKGFEAADSRIKVLHQENKNAGAARNNGMQYASGEYYSFLDADDFFEPEMLEKAYNRAKSQNADIVIFGCENYYEDKDKHEIRHDTIKTDCIPAKDTFKAEEVKNAFFAIIGWPWDKLFSAGLINALGLKFQEQRTSNDTYFVYSAYAMAERITLINEPLVHYRRSSASLSVTRERTWMCFLDALIMLKKQLIEWNIFEKFERDFVNYCLHLTLWQIKSLSWPTQEILYNVVKYAWFEKLGVTGREPDYFYCQEEYEALERIMSEQCADIYPGKKHFTEKQDTLIKEKEALSQRVSELENSNSYKIGRAATFPVRKIKQILGK